MLLAFDLIHHDGQDLRDLPLLDRKRHLAKLLSKSTHAIRFSEHLDHDGAAVFEHACRLGLEGIVSKRIDAPYRSGPSKAWLKSKDSGERGGATRAGRGCEHAPKISAT